MIEDWRTESVIVNGEFVITVTDVKGETPRAGEGLGGGVEGGEGESGESEGWEGRTKDEPGDDEDYAEDYGEADHGGEEGAEEWAGSVGARWGWVVVLRGCSVGVLRCGAVVVVVRWWGWVAGGGLLHSVVISEVCEWNKKLRIMKRREEDCDVLLGHFCSNVECCGELRNF